MSTRRTQNVVYARFLENVVEAVSPQVTWESEITGRTVIDSGQRGHGVLRKTAFVGSDVVVGRRNALAKNGE